MAVLAESLVYGLSGSPQTLSPSRLVGTSSCSYSLDYDKPLAVEMEACHFVWVEAMPTCAYLNCCSMPVMVV